MYAADEVYDTAELEDDDDPEPTHADHYDPDPDCEDCQEDVAQMWENVMRPY